MADVDRLLQQLRAAAAVHATDWLHALVGGLLMGAVEGGMSMQPLLYLRLSPDVSLRVQHHTRSPMEQASRDPLAPARKRRSQARPGRNPLPRRDSRDGSGGLPWLIPPWWVRCTVRSPGLVWGQPGGSAGESSVLGNWPGAWNVPPIPEHAGEPDVRWRRCSCGCPGSACEKCRESGFVPTDRGECPPCQ